MRATLDPALASQLRIVTMRLARRMRRERADDALTPSQVSALSALERHGPLPLGELASHEHVRPPSMTRIAGALEDAGYVARTPHPTDRRQVLLAATRAGVKLLAEDRRRRDAWLCKRLSTYTPEELETLRKAAVLIERLAAE